ncbi:MAG TPA: serine/threonine-protein kinase, partial [Polyangia bacterium]|nr:serine/threonine-protein kinase [Polyangia bacterium]
ARHLRLERPVAVKFLPPELAADPAFEARFAREARALALLSHPHVVGVHDFGTSEAGESYLVMELVPGGTLADRLPLPAPEATRVAAQICDGLAYAHGKGIVHRDVKPENVLFGEDGRAKVADFGIARLREPTGSDPLTRPSLVLGTPAYMAPEARAGVPPDPRMDVYAVGVLLGQMITGRLPDGNLDALPRPLAALVQRATAVDPRHRPTAAELRDALHALPAPSARADELPADELSWMRAVALTLAGATAVALSAFLVSVTPKVLPAGETLPFVVLGEQRLPDGRVATQARFETWPTLGAAAAFAVALAAYGLLRRHWRHAGIEVAAPERPLRAAGAVVRVALLILALFAGRLILLGLGIAPLGTPYMPVVGGTLELVMVYLTWMAVLEAQRTRRPLRREPLLWAAVVVSLVPPAISIGRILVGLPPL